MRRCHNCGLSIGDTATFCATCGEPTPAAAACRLCRDAAPALGRDDLCETCSERIGLLVAEAPDKRPMASLAGRGPVAGPARITVANAIYSAVADEATCPECAAMDGRETTDIETAAGWAPNARCSAPGGCRCAVFFEHEWLAAGEQSAFVEFAAGRGLPAVAATVAAFHAEQLRRRERVDRELDEAAELLTRARACEKAEPPEAAALYERAIELFLACSETPLDEREVRRELPQAFNRLSLVLKNMGRAAEALEAIDRAAALGLLERVDCGRKADRDALSKRARRLRELVAELVPA
jgi:tetratricopeptide (TPR) repeat protein